MEENYDDMDALQRADHTDRVISRAYGDSDGDDRNWRSFNE